MWGRHMRSLRMSELTSFGITNSLGAASSSLLFEMLSISSSIWSFVSCAILWHLWSAAHSSLLTNHDEYEMPSDGAPLNLRSMWLETSLVRYACSGEMILLKEPTPRLGLQSLHLYYRINYSAFALWIYMVWFTVIFSKVGYSLTSMFRISKCWLAVKSLLGLRSLVDRYSMISFVEVIFDSSDLGLNRSWRQTSRYWGKLLYLWLLFRFFTTFWRLLCRKRLI